MFNNTAVFGKENLVDMQRRMAIVVIDRALARSNTQDVSARFDNDHGDGWDALLDRRSELEAQIARHQT